MCIFFVHVMPAITCYLENWTKSEKNVRNEIMLLIQEQDSESKALNKAQT
jgi:hypothetical protein